jgi:type II secretory pathway predicted ATPase ExeA
VGRNGSKWVSEQGLSRRSSGSSRRPGESSGPIRTILNPALRRSPEAAYLRHHLALVRRDEPLFADDAIARLHRVSSGLPRALNNAATAALIAAAAAGQDLVDDACAKKAVAELTRD